MKFPHETRIVWTELPLDLRYLRESFVPCARRCGPVPWRGAGRVVGYAELDSDAPRDLLLGYRRRVWWLKPADADPELPPPYEAVEPHRIRVGWPTPAVGS